MTDSFLLDASVEPLAGGDFNDAWSEALRRAPAVVRYGAALLLVGVAVAVGFALKSLVTPANLTLIFVLPVVIAATSFGWGPSLATVVAGVLAFDFFFTEPYFQFTIASATDLWAAILLFIIAAIVSAVAAEAQRRAASAQRAARQASALQVVAHMVIEGRPRREIVQMAAWSLGQLFGAPSSIFKEGVGGMELVAVSAGTTITSADEEAAHGAVTLHLPSRARSYPFEESHFDFWPVQTSAEMFVLGVDFSRAADGRPAHPERLIEVVGAYLAAPGSNR
jgi:K+-sensing histidine kinase KdpD